MTLQPSKTRRLADCFSALLAFVLSLLQMESGKQLSYEDARKEILRLLKESETSADGYACAPEDYDPARYAVCAWIDEAILSSSWTPKTKWRTEQLQRLVYQSADAGEKFFERLKNLEANQQAVREVYLLCLALGFKGRYCEPDDQFTLDQLKERHLKMLFNRTEDVPSIPALEKSTLFPEAYQQSSVLDAKSIGRFWGWPMLIAVPLLGIFVFFLTYRLTLYTVGAAILKGVRS